jgi:ATP-dependent DNA helicase RecQ
MKRTEWQSIGRELVRLGFLRQSTEKFATVELTHEGLTALKERRKITLTKPVTVADKKPKVRRGEIECDEALFDRLRAVRRRLADERNVPAYIVFSDVPLREMARLYPTNIMEFGQIAGVGQQKLKDFSEPFIEEIKHFLKDHPRQDFE